MPIPSGYVYILTNEFGNVMYVGATHDLFRRVQQHKDGTVPGFTAKYRVKKLVYFEYGEFYASVRAREKQIKGWSRNKKDRLVDTMNPRREDLFQTLRFATS